MDDTSKTKEQLIHELGQLRERVAQLETSRAPLIEVESAMRESEAHFRSLVQHSPDLIVILEADSTIQYVSDASEHVFGYAPEMMVGHSGFEFIHSDDLSEIRRAFAEVIKRPGAELSEELRLLDSDGSWHAVEVTGSNRLGDPAVEGVVLHVRDITERKTIEEALHASLERITRAKQEWEATADALPQLICLLDSRGRVVRANRTVESWGLGPPADVRGLEIHDLLHPQCEGPACTFQRAWSQEWAKVTQGQPAECEVRDELLGRWLQFQARPISGQGGGDAREAGSFAVIAIEDNTQRKQAELSLQENEAKARALLNAPPDVVHLIDTDGTILDLNEETARKLGRKREELLGRSVYDFFPPSVAHRRKAQADEVVRAGKPVRFEDQRGDILYDSSLYPVFGAEGRVAQIAIVARDITEQRMAERALQESEEKLRRVVSQARDGISIVDERGVVTEWNRAMVEITGLERQDVVGKLIWDAQLQLVDEAQRTPETYARLETGLREFLRTGQAPWMDRTMEREYTRPDGSRLYVEGMVYAIQTYKGFVLVSVSRDITERKQAEQALRESEERYRSLVENAPLCIHELGLDGRVLSMNAAGLSMVGAESDQEVIGRDYVSFVSPGDRERIVRLLQAALDGQSSEFEYLAAGKHDQVFKSSFVPLRDSDGAVVRLMGITEDITERKHEERVQTARFRLIEYAANHTVMELLQEFLDEAEALTNSEIGFYHFLEDDQKTLSLQTWSTNTLQNMCTAEGAELHYPISQAGVWVDCVRERRPVIHNDYASLPHRKGLPEGHAPVIRELVVPVLRGKKIVAILGVGNKRTDYEEHDVKTVQQLADLAWETIVRRQAEEALRESEEQYRTLVESSADHIFLLGDENVYLASNDRVDQFGLARGEQLVGCHVQDVYSPDLANQYEQQLLTVRSSGQAVSFEHVIETSRGERYHLDTLYPIFREGEVYAVGGICHDITERKRAEEALRESEEKYRTVIEQSMEGVALIDEEGNIVEWNQANERMTGLRRDEVLGMPFWNMVAKTFAPERQTAQRRESIRTAVLEALQTGQSPLFVAPIETEFYPWPGKEKRYIHQAIFPIETEKGYRLASLTHDITERIQAEEVQRRLNRELRAISSCNQTLLRAVDEQTLLNDICHIVCDEAGYRMAWVGYAENDDAKTIRPVAWAGFESGYLTNVKISWADDTAEGRGPAGIAIRSGEIYYVQDFATDLRMTPWRERALQRSYRSTIALPLKDENANTFGGLFIYASEPYAITPDEVRILGQLAGDLAFGIVTLRTRAKRKMAEEALRESEGRYRTLFEDSPISLWEEDLSEVKKHFDKLHASGITDLRTHFENHPEDVRYCAELVKVLDVNKATLALVGANTKDELLAPLSPVLAEESLPVFRAELIVLAEGGQRFESEMLHRTIAGEIRFVVLQINVAPGYESSLGKVLVSISDVTERKRAEEALREKTEELDRYFTNALDLLCIADTDGYFRRLNPEWESTLGFSVSELEGQRFLDFVHPDDLGATLQVLSQLAEQKEVLNFTNRYRCKGGAYRWIEWRSFPQETYIYAVARDITERKRVEEELAWEAAVNAAMAELLRVLLSSASIEEVSALVLEQARKLTGSEFGYAGYIDPQTGYVVAPTLTTDVWDVCQVPDKDIVFKEFNGLWGWVLENRESLMTNSPASDPRSTGTPPGHVPIRRVLSVPALIGDTLLGQLTLANPGRDYTERDLALAERVASVYALAIQQTRLHEQIQRHAEELERRVADRTRELAALYEVTAVASESLDLRTTLERSLEQVLGLVRSNAGAVQLLDETEETLRLTVQRGIPPDVVARIDSMSRDQSLEGRVIEHGEPLVVADMAADPRVPHAARALGFHAYIGVPIQARGRALGVLSVFVEVGQRISVEEVALLTSITDHVGVAVENARLRQRAERAAVMEERERLARELHDSVTQSLYSMTLFAEGGRELVRLRDWKHLGDSLGVLKETAQQALKEMRLLVYELRPAALAREGLVGALQQRLDAVEGRADMEARLLVEGVEELPAHIERELYRIAQEALNNALKHAAATCVTVCIRAKGKRPVRQVELEVADNGRGFDPDAASDKGGMGLTSMRERAERLGGSFHIVSAPGKGTRVRVDLEVSQ